MANRQQLAEFAYWDETQCVQYLLKELQTDARDELIYTDAERLIIAARKQKLQRGAVDALLEEFNLSSQEGTALMCVAEALLRIPDGDKADALIHEKILQGDWSKHLAHSESLFVNASTWGLLLTGKWFALEDHIKAKPWQWLQGLMHNMGDGVIRQCVRQAMRLMGEQYILGKNPAQALKRGKKNYPPATRFSFDALGEGARTQTDADKHLKHYQNIIEFLSQHTQPANELMENHSVSIKLSALHPRYQWSQRDRLDKELIPVLIDLCLAAIRAGVGLTIDAEEAERLDLCIHLFEQLALHPQLKSWTGLGFVVQAYQKRAHLVIDWLQKLSDQRQTKLCVRLVKGAYWDREIKHAQALGLADYSVFTRKAHTDLSYLFCAQKLLKADSKLYPQFATHNAATIAAVCHWANNTDFELQRLHGMGGLLYDNLETIFTRKIPVRVYAPIGNHQELLPYLVRRLLENGANSSFVNRFLDEQIPPAELCRHPMLVSQKKPGFRNQKIPLPQDVYSHWLNSPGLDLANPIDLVQVVTAASQPIEPLPAITLTTQHTPEDIFSTAKKSFQHWSQHAVEERANCLEAIGRKFSDSRFALIQVITQEAGRTLADAQAEVRETIEFCYYYAYQCRRIFNSTELSSITGETNELSWQARGIFLAISPWNFPLALFCGPILAALAAGNAVVAKPAEQTPQCALLAAKLMREAGLPEGVLQLVCGDGNTAKALIEQRDIAGITFTGSTQTAHIIHQQLAQRDGPIIPFIAETGGINTFWIDSSALLEQAIDDVVQSAFLSAGQRCSSARVLFLQKDIADRALELLFGACAQLTVGPATKINTDIGPIIDRQAWENINTYIDAKQQQWPLLYRHSKALPDTGFFIGPHIFSVPDFAAVDQEIFGPVLHVVQFTEGTIDKQIQQIKASQFALTLGIHSRIDSWTKTLQTKLAVGNTYINRNTLGAVVGTQPFGGHGLSGTGPKAGGPNYLQCFAIERTITTNTVASGGNAGLFNLEE